MKPSLPCKSCSTPCPCAASCAVPVDVPGADLAFRVTWPGDPPADYSALRRVIVRTLLREFQLASFDLALQPTGDGTILAVVTNAANRKATHGGVKRYQRYLQFARGQVVPA